MDFSAFPNRRVNILVSGDERCSSSMFSIWKSDEMTSDADVLRPSVQSEWDEWRINNHKINRISNQPKKSMDIRTRCCLMIHVSKKKDEEECAEEREKCLPGYACFDRIKKATDCILVHVFYDGVKNVTEVNSSFIPPRSFSLRWKIKWNRIHCQCDHLVRHCTTERHHICHLRRAWKIFVQRNSVVVLQTSVSLHWLL